ncbi:MAG: hypothetical protein WDO68_21530 [Gammaproteobacteria bacterium]
MSFTKLFRCCRAALIALAVSAPTFAAEQHNFIVLVPEALAAAVVDPMTAPALARLRAQGVYFINSHTGFPAEELAGAAVDSLVAPTGYSSVRIGDPVAADSAPPPEDAPVAVHSASVEEIAQEVLPELKKRGKPFLLVYRLALPVLEPPADADSASSRDSRDDPPAAMLALFEVDGALATLEKALQSLDLFETTNIVVAAEHGFSSVWKASKSSVSLQYAGKARERDQLPPGFLAIDIVDALQVADAGVVLFDPNDPGKIVDYTSGEYPSRGDAIIAVDPEVPYATIEAHGGYDLIHLPEDIPTVEARRRAGIILDALFKQDYVGGLFVDEMRLGRVRGALPVEHLGFRERSRKPAIVVSFASLSADCDRPMVCTWTVADTVQDSGETFHLAMNRAVTSNFMAARGPDFQKKVVSRVPASSADVMATVAELIGARAGGARTRGARVLTEALRGHEKDPAPQVKEVGVASKPSEDSEWVTEVRYQVVEKVKYFDAAGYGGWTVGIPEREGPREWRPWRWDWPFKTFEIKITP